MSEKPDKSRLSSEFILLNFNMPGDDLLKLSEELEKGHFDRAIHKLDERLREMDPMSPQYAKPRRLYEDLLEARNYFFDPEMDDFTIDQANPNRKADGFEITFFVVNGEDKAQLERMGYSTNTDEEGMFASRHIPGKWEICERCDGHGKHIHPAMHVITESDREEMGEDEFHTAVNGGYDVKCEEGCDNGKVFVIKDDVLHEFEKKAQRHQEEEEAHYQAVRASERRMGA